MSDLNDPHATESELAIRRAAVVEALKTHPPDTASMWARAMLIAGRLRADGPLEARDDTQPLQREEPKTPSTRRGIAGT